MEELPIIGQTPRQLLQQKSGIKDRQNADEKMYPVPGQGVHHRTVEEENLLPVIDVQHLTTAPSLKSWLDSQEGEPLVPEHESVISALKNARSNGAPINLNVNGDGKYDIAFSGANGNMVRIVDFKRLLDAGLPLGDCLRVTKLVCGPNGVCGNPGPCMMCQDIRDGCYADAVYGKLEVPDVTVLDAEDSIDEEINLLVTSGEHYYLHERRIVNGENSKGANVDEVKALCQQTGRGVIYVLEMLGVYRATEAASHTALKRGDLGGH